MTSKEFSINFGDFNLHQNEGNFDRFQSKASKNLRLEQLEFALRFACLDEVNTLITNYESRGKHAVRFFEVASIASRVVLMLIGVMFPVAMYYLPSWAPFVIGITASFIFTKIRKTYLDPYVDSAKRSYQGLLYMKGMLESDSVKVLHPLGEWDLPAIDPRLKSDKRFKQKHPQNAIEVERLVGTTFHSQATFFSEIENPKSVRRKFHALDLRIDTNTKREAATCFSFVNTSKARWQEATTTVSKAKEFLPGRNYPPLKRLIREIRGKPTSYPEIISQAANTGYQVSSSYELPAETPKDHVLKIARLYAYLTLLYPKMEELYEEGKKLYGFEYLPEEVQDPPSWKEYHNKAIKMKEAMQPYIDLLTSEDTSTRDFILAVRAIKEQNLFVDLIDLIDQARVIKACLEQWQEKSPQKQLRVLEKELVTYKKEILSRGQIKALSQWIAKHRSDSKKYIIKLDESFSKEIAAFIETTEERQREEAKEIEQWLTARPERRLQTPETILKRNRLMYTLRKNVKKEYWKKFSEENVKESLKSEEGYTNLKTQINDFKVNHLNSLRELIGKQGDTSPKIIRVVKAVLCKIPAQPFKKGKIPEHPYARHRKFEELAVDKLLKQIDEKMLYTDRVRSYGLEWAAMAVLAVVTPFFLSNPWVLLGISGGMLGIQGLSFFVDYKLQKMNDQKQTLKLANFLRDRPLIKDILGAHPRLSELAAVQNEHDLDNVALTRASVQIKGDKFLAKDSEKKKVAKKGRSIAINYLEPRLVILKSNYRTLDSNSKEAKAIHKRIEEINATLEREPQKGKSYKPKVSDYEKLVIQRTKIEQERSHKKEELLKLKLKQKDLEMDSQLFERIPAKLNKMPTENVIKTRVQLIEQAMQGDHERTSKEKIADILADINRDKEGKNTEKNLNRLIQVPVDDLYVYEAQLESELELRLRLTITLNNNAVEYNTKDPARAKERVDEKIKTIKTDKTKLEDKISCLQNEYNELTEEIKKVRPNINVVSKSTPKDELDKLLANDQKNKDQLWKQNKATYRQLYSQLSETEKKSIWWSLPQLFRDELTGDQLFKRDKPKAEGGELIWLNKSDEALRKAFMRIESHQQKRVYHSLHSLSQQLQNRLKLFYHEYSGEKFLEISRKVLAHTKIGKENLDTWWKENGVQVEADFKKINFELQQGIFDQLPKPFQEKLKPFFYEYTGEGVIVKTGFALREIERKVLSKKISREKRSDAIDEWWTKNKEEVLKAYVKIEKHHMREFLRRLPLPIREKLEVV